MKEKVTVSKFTMMEFWSLSTQRGNHTAMKLRAPVESWSVENTPPTMATIRKWLWTNWLFGTTDIRLTAEIRASPTYLHQWRVLEGRLPLSVLILSFSCSFWQKFWTTIGRIIESFYALGNPGLATVDIRHHILLAMQ